MRANDKRLHEKLRNGSYFLMKYHPFFSDIYLQCSFFEDAARVPTAGVNVSYRGFNFYYNPEFIDSLNQKQVNFLIIHELYHLLHSHVFRGAKSDHTMNNIVQDMVINTGIIETFGESTSISEFESDPKLERPSEGICLVPMEYEDAHIFELLKEWVEDNLPPQQQPQEDEGEGQGGSGEGEGQEQQNQDGNSQDSEGQGEGQGQGQGKQPKAVGEKKSRWDDGWKDALNNAKQNEQAMKGIQFDEHLEDEVPPEMREQMVKDAIESAKTRGLVRGDIEKILEGLRKPRKNYLKEIKAHIGGMVGTMKHDTWQRFSRRATGEFLSKGYKKYRKSLNVILDTSGSMSNDFERVLSYIFVNGIEVNLIQIDTEVRANEKITSKKMLQRLKIQGLGGTILQPGIDHVVENAHLNKLPTILMTDGYCDSLKIAGLNKQLLILSTEAKVETDRHCKQVVIEKLK